MHIVTSSKYKPKSTQQQAVPVYYDFGADLLASQSVGRLVNPSALPIFYIVIVTDQLIITDHWRGYTWLCGHTVVCLLLFTSHLLQFVYVPVTPGC